MYNEHIKIHLLLDPRTEALPRRSPNQSCFSDGSSLELLTTWMVQQDPSHQIIPRYRLGCASVPDSFESCYNKQQSDHENHQENKLKP